MMTTERPDHLLHQVARVYNVQTSYYDVFGRLTESPAEAILRVLKMLQAPVERMEDLPDALRHRRQFLWQRGIAPVVVAWNGGPATLTLRLPGQLPEGGPRYHLTLESGQVVEGECHDDGQTKPVQRDIEGVRYVARRVTIPQKLPLGYHRLRLESGGRALESFLFAAPVEAFAATANAKEWGLFCPLYALHSEQSWGTGSFSDLQALTALVTQFGGHAVGTLPLLAAFLDEPFNPSPYAPVSRFFWNEVYLDVTRMPDLQRSPAARAIVNSPGFQRELKRLRAAPLVDYRRAMALKRRVFDELARSVWKQRSQTRTSFQRFIDTHPQAQDYAAFRAKTERERRPWEQWPRASRDGTLNTGDYDEAVKQYHLYVQWQAHEQMRTLGEKAKTGRGATLYLDFPLGVNRDGYDTWRERSVFALGASGGAPPDTFFTKGQNWGFPPLDPEGLRCQGYRYYIQCLRHHLAYAGMLRIDHVMGLHRLYWIPLEFEATQGVYVRYPAEEFYAVLNLECHRHKAQIVGENLGTVPPYVNAAMARHKIKGMSVGQFCVGTDPNNALERIPDGAVASLNTHDTPTFAGFWTETDIQDRTELGLLTGAKIEAERSQRRLQREALLAYLRSRGGLSQEAPDTAAILQAWLFLMAKSDANLLLVNLEDLWLEPAPQNVPGTWEERPNWRRKAKFSLESIREIQSIAEALKTIDELRKQRR